MGRPPNKIRRPRENFLLTPVKSYKTLQKPLTTETEKEKEIEETGAQSSYISLPKLKEATLRETIARSPRYVPGENTFDLSNYSGGRKPYFHKVRGTAQRARDNLWKSHPRERGPLHIASHRVLPRGDDLAFCLNASQLLPPLVTNIHI